MSELTLSVGRAIIRHIDFARPDVSRQLAEIKSHLLTKGDFRYDPPPSLSPGGGSVTLGSFARLLEQVHEHMPSALSRVQIDDAPGLIAALRSNARDLHGGRLPSSPDAPLYRLPSIMDDTAAGVRMALAEIDVDAIELARRERIEATRRAAIGVANSIQV